MPPHQVLAPGSPPQHDYLHEILRQRRTVHDFLPEVPPADVVLAAIDCARWAPNHHHTEPWRFYLLSQSLSKEVAKLNAALVLAKSGEQAAASKLKRWLAMPGWLAVTCQRSEDVAREREDYAACCCAVQNMMLALWSAGIGTKWGTGKVTRDERFLRLLGASPATEFVVGLFWYGYPLEVPSQRRRAVEEIVKVVET